VNQFRRKMLSEESSFEGQYTPFREGIFNLIMQGAQSKSRVLEAFAQCFNVQQNPTLHGPILWALIPKTNGINSGVIGQLFMQYLEYYYYYLALKSQRKGVNRPIDDTSMAFLVCVAAFGYTRGSEEFYNTGKTGNIQAIQSMVISRPNFLSFIWSDSLDVFSFLTCWRIIDNLWDLWDVISPAILIQGFTTDTVTFQVLHEKLNQDGCFVFRFSSKGGLAVDYVANGQLKKILWKENTVPDCRSFLSKLYDNTKDGNFLKYIIDINTGHIFPKEQAFPLQNFNQFVGDTGYSRVDDGIEEMNTEGTTNFTNFFINSGFRH